jgi:hypothetical protein
MKEEAMPHTVTKEIKVSELRKDDVFADGHAHITDITKKQVWSIVELDGARTLRMRLTDSVTVNRIEPTDEEKQASRNEMVRDMLASELRGMLDKTPLKVLEEIVAKARDKDEYTFDLLTSWNLPDVLKTQALHKQALIIRGQIHHEGGHVAVEDATLDELITGFAMWWSSNVGHTMLSANVDPTSRSTSAISNLLEDIDRWAIGRIVDRLTWSGARELVLVRVAELKAEWKNR